MPFISHNQRSRGSRPSRTPRHLPNAPRIALAIAKRSAMPVNGGMPVSPTRIAAQVVPQITTSRTTIAIESGRLKERLLAGTSKWTRPRGEG
ncbi:MAG: hypothetical protein HC882_06700 [Acidobacteria bacterium]|nr:hypothetical protein [Acidobacteriota bacterium]